MGKKGKIQVLNIPESIVVFKHRKQYQKNKLTKKLTVLGARTLTYVFIRDSNK